MRKVKHSPMRESLALLIFLRSCDTTDSYIPKCSGCKMQICITCLSIPQCSSYLASDISVQPSNICVQVSYSAIFKKICRFSMRFKVSSAVPLSAWQGSEMCMVGQNEASEAKGAAQPWKFQSSTDYSTFSIMRNSTWSLLSKRS